MFITHSGAFVDSICKIKSHATAVQCVPELRLDRELKLADATLWLGDDEACRRSIFLVESQSSQRTVVS